MSRSRAVSLLYVAPLLVAALWLFLPVIAGEETLFLRDVFNTHLEMKWFQAEAMRSGTLPLVDPYRSGGQPHLGNPNTVPLYPDNLLYLVASPIWALNAHFWLHFLLAPLAAFYLARQVGFGRPASWFAGVAYATSGYYLSTLNLYNLSASTTLAPAFLGACIAIGRSERSGAGGVLAAALWALLVLGGDPMTAVVVLLAGVAIALVSSRARGGAVLRLITAVALGTLVATPQVVEFLRIAPASYRGVAGYSAQAATVASWSPANLLEWLLPMAFGPPDLLYWGQRFHAGRLPLFYSFYPGLVALVLALYGTRRGRPWVRWSWTLVAAGVFFAMGSYNPLSAWMLSLPGMQIFRLPVKLWVLVACGLAVLAGGGMQRFLDGSADRQLRRWLVGFLLLFGLLGGGLVLAGGAAAEMVAGWMPSRMPQGHAAAEVRRWAWLCGISVAVLAAALMASLLPRFLPGRRRMPDGGSVAGRLDGRVIAGALLVVVHVAGQMALLSALVPTDSVSAYRQRQALLDHVPAEGRVVHGDAGGLFGPAGVNPALYETPELRWLQRQTFQQLYPAAGTMARRRYEFWSSPEGLDSFLTRAAGQALPLLDDARRISLLEASGVTHLLLTRELTDIPDGRVELAWQLAGGTYDLNVYALERAPPEAHFVGRVLRAADARQALMLLTDPTFDARQTVVLAGTGPPSLGGRGQVEIVSSDAESITVRLHVEAAGAVLFQRSYLPIYSAALDGEPVEIAVANLHRMAVEVGRGEHELRLWVDRRTLAPSFLVSALGMALLVLRLRRRESVPPTQRAGGDHRAA